MSEDKMSEAKMSEDEVAAPPFVIERVLDAPVGLVWSLWTDPEHFKSWYGPSGATIPAARMDVRVGGARFVTMEMSTPNGPMRMSFGGEYVEVVENLRLVYTEYMADESGVAMPNGHPETQVVVELEDLGEQTKMTLTHLGVPAGSPGAAGWTMALDSLVSYAATLV
jgi:uncharacterized protein YndB with AHSA1/START domain